MERRDLLLLLLAPVLELTPTHAPSKRRDRRAQEASTTRLVRRHARDTGTGKPAHQSAVTLCAGLSGVRGLLAVLLLAAVRTTMLLLLAVRAVLLVVAAVLLLLLGVLLLAVRPVLLPLVSVLSVALLVAARVVWLLGRVLLLLAVWGPVPWRWASAVALVRAAVATLVLAAGRRGRAVALLRWGLVAAVLLR